MSKNIFHNKSRATFLITHAIANFNFGTSVASDFKQELSIPESLSSKMLGIQRLEKRIALSIKRAEAREKHRRTVVDAAKARHALKNATYGPGKFLSLMCDNFQ